MNTERLAQEVALMAQRLETIDRRLSLIEQNLPEAARQVLEPEEPEASLDPPWRLDNAELQAFADSLYGEVRDEPNHALKFDLPSDGAYLHTHATNVSRLSMFLARRHGLSESSVRTVGLCALLHDAGMDSLPSEIVSGGRPLSSEEYRQVRRHPAHGATYIREHFRFGGLLDSVVPLVVEQHHERNDGSGYPNGMAADSIHDFARILAVADSYEAMTTPRLFRGARHPSEAMRSLLVQGYRTARGGMYDREILKTFVMATSLYPIGCEVKLSDGRSARVIQANNDPKRPVVKIIAGADKGSAIDLSLAPSDLKIV